MNIKNKLLEEDIELLINRKVNERVDEIMSYKPKYKNYKIKGNNKMKVIDLDFINITRKNDSGESLVCRGYIEDRLICDIHETLFKENNLISKNGKKYRIVFYIIPVQERVMRTYIYSNNKNPDYVFHKPFAQRYYKELKLEDAQREAQEILEHNIFDLFFVEKGKKRQIITEKNK